MKAYQSYLLKAELDIRSDAASITISNQKSRLAAASSKIGGWKNDLMDGEK